jgi:hypothetical protein
MFDVSVHVYYDNRSLSSAWPAKFLSIPRVGESVSFVVYSGDVHHSWVVEEVIHYPMQPQDEESGEMLRPNVAIFLRPADSEPPPGRVKQR